MLYLQLSDRSKQVHFETVSECMPHKVRSFRTYMRETCHVYSLLKRRWFLKVAMCSAFGPSFSSHLGMRRIITTLLPPISSGFNPMTIVTSRQLSMNCPRNVFTVKSRKKLACVPLTSFVFEAAVQIYQLSWEISWCMLTVLPFYIFLVFMLFIIGKFSAVIIITITVDLLKLVILLLLSETW